jgi:hypothetical protein
MMPRAFVPITAPPALLFAAVLFCSGAAAGSEPSATPEARVHFDAGVNYLVHERYAEAYREFTEAYAITPRWTVLGNLGIAAEHLERDGEAIDVMEQYLARGGPELGRSEARKFRSAIDRLKKGIAMVSLKAPGSFWIVDTRTGANGTVVNQYGPFEDRAELRVRAGQHEFKVEHSSIAARAWSAGLVAGDVATHSFEVEPPATASNTFERQPVVEAPKPDVELYLASHTISYVLWGIGAAGAIATTLVLLEGNRIQNDADEEFERRCPLGAGIGEGENVTDGSERAAHWRTAGLLTGIGALGALATGTVFYFIDSSGPPGSRHGNEVSVEPWLSPAGVGVSGRF